jgi:integrase
MRRKISTGSVFQRPYRDKQTGEKRLTATWFVKYYVSGKPVVVPAGTTAKDEAVAMLRQKMAGVAQQLQFSEHPERVRMDQLFDLMLDIYRRKERSTTYDVEKRVDAHLRPFFGKVKAQAVTPSQLRRYVDARRRDKPTPENATINKELAYVRRAMRLAAEEDPPLVLRVPKFDMLPIDNAREGTLSHTDYQAVRDLLPAYARIALVVAYHTGARKGEIRKVRIDRIDFKAGRIELQARTTKNKHPRYLPIYGDMAAELEMAIAQADPKCPLLVQRDGASVFDFEKAWRTACTAANVTGALFHDLRRTAVTNMIEAGLSEKEAMEISGHKTRNVFDRYHIVSDRRLKQNATKMEQHLAAKAEDERQQLKGAVN